MSEIAVFNFDKCPHCGGKRKLAGEATEQSKAQGYMHKTSAPFLFQATKVMIDQGSEAKVLVGAKVPAVATWMDVCLLCGAVYAVRAEISSATLQVTQGKPPQGGPQLSKN